MSKDNKFNFLNTDEQERYQKHLTLKEIGYEGQLDLKTAQYYVLEPGGLGFCAALSSSNRNWKNWNSR